jgi:hypothetical protein
MVVTNQNPNFRINAVNHALTYPQCPLDKQVVLDHLLALAPDNIQQIIVARELHEDGNYHLHAAVKYKRKKDIRNAKYYDIEFEGQVYHPNIQQVKFEDAWDNYIEKDGDFVSFGEPSKKRSKTDFGALISAATNTTDFIQSVVDADPETAIRSFTQLKAFAEYQFKPTLPVYVSNYSLADFPRLPAELSEWYDTEFKSPNRPISLVLKGVSKLGKTEWARSLGRHMYFNTHFDFKNRWDPDAEYIIFDDFDFEFIPNKKCFFGAQREFAITDKYASKRTVLWGKPAIFLTNAFFDYPEKDRLWYLQNTKMIELKEALY